MALWFAAAAATALWLLLLLVLATATRSPTVRPGPPTGEIAAESPAIVDLITGDWRLCDEAASATLLDLAAKGALQIEEIGPELSLVRLRRPVNLNSYERLVYDHVASLAVDGVVATGALAEGSRDLARWWKSFRKKVISEARAQGLSRPRWSRTQALLLTAAAAVPAGVIAIMVEVNGAAAEVSGSAEDDRGGIGAAVIAFAALCWLMGRLNGERGTGRGAEVAAHWLGFREHLAGGRFADQPAASVTIWGRHLAYAAALGLAPQAVGSLPVSVPADDRRAWSDYGGMWHAVTIRYPRPILWGREPVPTIFRALAAGAFIGFWTWVTLVVAAAFEVWPDGLVQSGAVGVGVGVAAVPIALALVDLTTTHSARGQVVRLRRRQVGSSGDNPKYAYWCAIDEGREREIKAFGLDSEKWHALHEGDIVRASLGRRLGWIKDIEVVERSRHRAGAAYSDTGEHLIDAPRNLGEVKLFGRDAQTPEHGPQGSGSSGDRAAGPELDPAELVTPADLRRTLGIQVGAAAPYTGALPIPAWLAVQSCRYRSDAGVTVDVHAATGLRSRLLMVLGHTLTRTEGRPVPGVGSAAMLYPGVVSAQTSRGTFALNVTSSTGPPPPDALIDLARTVAARLG